MTDKITPEEQAKVIAHHEREVRESDRQRRIIEDSLRRARANLDTWTREFMRAAVIHPIHGCGNPTGMPPFYRGYDVVEIPAPPGGVLQVADWPLLWPSATIIPFPLARTRRPKSEHTYEWKG